MYAGCIVVEMPACRLRALVKDLPILKLYVKYVKCKFEIIHLAIDGYDIRRTLEGLAARYGYRAGLSHLAAAGKCR